jgi:glycosyltransferase involved in cell wall biosynthesis
VIRKRVLLASPNHWHSAFQVGSHNLAREFARKGWDVAYISDPISPLHACGGLTRDLRRRVASWWGGGRSDCEGRVWSYVPAAWLTPHNKPLLRGDRVHRAWHRWTWPDLTRLIRSRGFGKVDLLYMDSTQQSFWLDAIDYRRAVYRVADYNPHFAKYTPATRRLEKETARRVDMVLCPSRPLIRYAEELGARRTLLLANGVDYDHYARPQPPPPEYAAIRRPIAVYMGVIPDWFHFEWVGRAARELTGVSFVLIGPDRLARQPLGGLPNVHLLGFRDYERLPAYLQHAQVGLMPFDVARNPDGVEALNPQKLYAYLACGIPVVSASWNELKELETPARLCATAPEFVRALRAALDYPGDPEEHRRFACGASWPDRLDTLLRSLDIQDAVASVTYEASR